MVDHTDYRISLREALILLRNNPPAGNKTIYLPKGRYVLTRSGNQEDNAQTGDLDVNVSDLRIVGAGSSTTSIDGNQADRIIDFINAPGATLEKLKLVNGKASDYAGSWFNSPDIPPVGGGAIRALNSGLLTLSDIDVRSNKINKPGFGGGVLVFGGCVTIDNSVFMTNTVNDGGQSDYYAGYFIGGGGGALAIINSACDSIIARSNLKNNSVVSSHFSMGGALFILNGSGSIHLDSSSFVENLLTGTNIIGGKGAAIYANFSNDLTVTNNTFSSNSVYAYGDAESSAIYMLGDQQLSTVSLINNTFVSGELESATGVVRYPSVYYAGKNLTLVNNIFSNENAQVPNDFGSSIANLGYNLFEQISQSSVPLKSSDKRNLDPRLGSLTLRQGVSLVHPLLMGSPAIDNGTLVELLDQRGLSRPIDGNGDAVLKPDIGAYENMLVDDPVLNSLVLSTLGLPSSHLLTASDLLLLTTIDLSNSSVRSLGGLQLALNLSSLNLNNTQLESLRPIVGLNVAVSYIGTSITFPVDSDGDTYPDQWEILNSSNPVVHDQDPELDTDGDGVPDGIEISNNFDIFNPLDTMTDIDGDGYSIGHETLEGTDPYDEDSYPRVENVIFISSGSDDVTHFSSNNSYSETLTYLPSENQNTLGLRFLVPVNKGEIIEHACLEFSSYGNYSGLSKIRIKIEDSVNAAPLTSGFKNRSYYSGANILWESNAAWSTNNYYQSPELKALLSYVTSRAAWQGGNYVLFSLSNVSSAPKRVAKSYENAVPFAPRLHVHYKRVPWDADGDGISDVSEVLAGTNPLIP